MLLWLSIGAALVMAVLLFRLFFKDLPDFVECLRFYFQPNFISLLRGEWQQDWWASTKLGVWAALSIAMGVAVQYKVPQFFPSLAAPRHTQVETVYASEAVTRSESEQIKLVSDTATNTAIPPAPAPVLDHAAQYGVKVGDTVEVVALNRTVALKRAIITALDSEQITVRSGVDSYALRWSDLNKLKPTSKK